MLAVILVFATTAAASYMPLAKPSHDELMAELATSDLVFLGRVVAVDHSMQTCAQSGYAIIYQSVTYELDRVLMGIADKQSVVVGHALWGGGTGQDSATGCLSPELFAVGAQLLILGKRHERVRDFDLVTNGDWRPE